MKLLTIYNYKLDEWHKVFLWLPKIVTVGIADEFNKEPYQVKNLNKEVRIFETVEKLGYSKIYRKII